METNSAAKISEAFRYAAASGARVISVSMSFESKTQDDDLAQAIFDAAHCGSGGGQGAVIVVSVGNEADKGTPQVHYPAWKDEVIAVGAVNKWGERWGYSNFGSSLDLMAPSGDDADWEWELGDIWTDDRVYSWGYNPQVTGTGDANGDLHYTSKFGGTSAACPQVAGVAALILARRPDIAAQCTPFYTVYEILINSADDIPPAGFDTLTGFGRVNAFHALLSISRGDINNDAVWDVVDVVGMTRAAFGPPLPSLHPGLSDISCDGITDVVDVVMMVGVAFRGWPLFAPCYKFDY